MTVVRATTATRVNSAGLIESVAINVPRLDYTGGGCPSILVEPQRTNLVLYSEEFDNIYWTKLNSTITANSATAPDGTLTADKLVENTLLGNHTVGKIGAIASAGTYTLSVYAKASERTNIGIGNTSSNHFAIFNLSSGTITQGSSGTVTNGVISSIDANGFYRVSCTITVTGAISVGIILVSTGTTISYTGNGTSGLFIWGAQLEAASNATSYIPTVASSVTRNADEISKTGISSLIGQTEGTLFVELNLTNVSQRPIFALDIGATTNYIASTTNSTNAVRLQVSSAGSATTLITTSALAIGFYKIAFAYKSGDYAIYINGVSAGTSSSTTFPIGTLSQFILSNASYGALNDSYNLATVFPTRLTNAQLATLTTL